MEKLIPAIDSCFNDETVGQLRDLYVMVKSAYIFNLYCYIYLQQL